MKQDERRLLIRKELEDNRKIEIEHLSLKFAVSEMTIRRDLEYLEGQGILQRVSRGAILLPLKAPDTIDDSLNTRSLQNIDCKKAIAKYAAKLVNDGDIIYLDASTTTYELCAYLAEKKLTIVTNSARICNYFFMTENISVILAGGVLRYGTLSLIGSDTENFLKQYNTNKSFISGKALSCEQGLTDINMFEVNTKKAAMTKTSEVILLLDHSKLNKTSLTKICDIKNISKIVIDGFKAFSTEEQRVLDYMEENGIEILLAK